MSIFYIQITKSILKLVAKFEYMFNGMKGFYNITRGDLILKIYENPVWSHPCQVPTEHKNIFKWRTALSRAKHTFTKNESKWGSPSSSMPKPNKKVTIYELIYEPE